MEYIFSITWTFPTVNNRYSWNCSISLKYVFGNQYNVLLTPRHEPRTTAWRFVPREDAKGQRRVNCGLTWTGSRRPWDPAGCSTGRCHRRPRAWPSSGPRPASIHGCCTGKPRSSSPPAAGVGTGLAPPSPPACDRTSVWEKTPKQRSLAPISPNSEG